ncbi:hypothetical protein FHS99_001194 [Sphingomonas prati]|uniref:Uncharacterized protein n=1 Tax=Sphingomonas prati TaxID=1843237 RepID=A0A7W9BRR4_9SPHN|nr:hypothetical protein [Sphingomonas prati]
MVGTKSSLAAVIKGMKSVLPGTCVKRFVCQRQL